MNPKHAAGFTLMEVLIAVWLLSVGLLGVAAYVTRSLQMVPANEHTARAMMIASQTVEPLERLLSRDRGGFRATLAEWQRAPRRLESGYEVTVTALDSQGNNVADTDPNGWQPPLLVTLRIGFPANPGSDGAPQALNTTRVFVP